MSNTLKGLSFPGNGSVANADDKAINHGKQMAKSPMRDKLIILFRTIALIIKLISFAFQ
jgi:hypothetical protein